MSTHTHIYPPIPVSQGRLAPRRAVGVFPVFCSFIVAGRMPAAVFCCPGFPMRGQAVRSCCPGLIEEGI